MVDKQNGLAFPKRRMTTVIGCAPSPVKVVGSTRPIRARNAVGFLLAFPFTLEDPCMEKGPQVAYNAAAHQATVKAVKEFLTVTFKLK
jgi:hypothetical protein